MVTQQKSRQQIKAMREGGKMLATVLQALKGQVKVGMTTKDIAILAGEELKPLGGEPAFLNYQGFPDVICVSVNEEVVHGIPKTSKVIKNGDIVGLDFGVKYKGLITDGAISIIAGQAKDQRHVKLVEDTERAMYKGIAVVRDNIRTGDIGYAVESYLKKKYGIVRDLVGHGVGIMVHEDPNIPNYGRAHTGPWLKKDMTIAIEPMVTLGSERVTMASDGWTILTADGSVSAHFEHTLLITEDGSEILTTL